MKIRQLGIDGGWEILPRQHPDARGLFLEWYRADLLAESVGHVPELVQGSLSVSAHGVVRGIHYADVPPGQAKFVTCVRGAVMDVVVDIRVGSPTFGRWEAMHLDSVDRRGVYIAEGLGHGVCALTDDATLVYLCSTTYNPGAEHTIHPFDEDVGVEWPVREPTLSARDAAAPTLAQMAADGLLPAYDTCRSYARQLRESRPAAVSRDLYHT